MNKEWLMGLDDISGERWMEKPFLRNKIVGPQCKAGLGLNRNLQPCRFPKCHVKKTKSYFYGVFFGVFAVSTWNYTNRLLCS